MARRNEVLAKMHELHEIGDAEETAGQGAAGRAWSRSPTNDRYPAPFFVQKVKNFIFNDAHFGATPADRERKLFEGGLTHRDHARPALAAGGGHRAARDPHRPDGPARRASSAIDPRDGHVKAYTSNLDFFDTDPAYRFASARKVDLADARVNGVPTRQPGSTFKPFVLATALDPGRPALAHLPGQLPRVIPPGWPASQPLRNFDDESYGRLNLIEATVNSVNTVYGQLVIDIGPQNVAEHREGDGHHVGPEGLPVDRDRRRSRSRSRTWPAPTACSRPTGCAIPRSSSPA